MKKPQWLFALLFLGLSPAFLQAQIVQSDRTKTSDRSQLHQDDAQLERDIREINTMSIYKDRIIEAFSINDLPSVQAMQSDILKGMQTEINQSKMKSGQAQAEIAESQDLIYQSLLNYEFTLDASGKAQLDQIATFIDLMEKDRALTEANMSSE